MTGPVYSVAEGRVWHFGLFAVESSRVDRKLMLLA
jgi:hypothetical protein